MLKIESLNRYFDHTALKPQTTEAQIRELCAQALEYNFISVCINPCHIPLAKDILAGSDTAVCTVIGFPLGSMSTKAKVFEAKDAVTMGAEEVDMVINVSYALDGKWDKLKQEILEVKKACGQKITLKVILETCLLTDEQIIKACQMSMQAGADFVKTSTGFSSAGATTHHVKLMRDTVGPNLGVKASGGIRTLGDTLAMIEAGATRIGASASVAIIKESKKEVN
ncbi:deoxyribose-phosphate aldolase [Clostridia bacterium]|nr:deoxyribose-phosphate aldolase [Clostridia bacterium]